MKEGKAPANIKGITLDTEDNTGDLAPLEKLMTLETVVLLNRKKQRTLLKFWNCF